MIRVRDVACRSAQPACRCLRRWHWRRRVVATIRRSPRRSLGAIRGDGGFTLLELLVILVVTGLLLAVLSQGLRLGLQTSATNGRIDRGAASLEATVRLVRALIARATPGDPDDQQPAFTGTTHAVAFVTMLPEGAGPAARQEAEVSLGVDASHSLVLRWRPHYRKWIVTPPPPATAALLDGVERLDVSFWKAVPGIWVSTWEGRDLPALVRLHIAFPNGDGRRWPDIVVAPVRSSVRP